ncbi:glutaredoxin family protein [Staphylococcus saccharolyticus]|uniref:glutaredoxin family protein n=1 Tax=Staphylococcus saccharolyticus TaxID=33028 RepID=UPI00102DD1DE|nr:glutaredoxin domain-containing protein [Staphylococcus saccharolyticus]MBL7572927.1 glutaredoxin family protein [Staphylococcus saccharolyticus]MBL7584137.1 glutaredoxin family protein [Staphylococcus saccharolyticus]MBL7638544.1 glutaredoxin family protein [Staphylococcus saccharolyticus]QRJ67959.1 glutaredoxin family protein [Staphylococcus saccharolyticus]TAA93461.1 NrdH-redoxin [Staphylococcus saccharolyticus]
MTSEVTIYTQDNCPPCAFIKNYLSEHNVDYVEKNIKHSQFRNEMIDYDAYATPFILLKGEPIYNVNIDKLNTILNL